ncbi:MAG: glutathione S-transferase family protein [Alphaproteobacteria bacterium]|nr:glutathione S-transferase family protein [Alphaproteobacteria bacterium]
MLKLHILKPSVNNMAARVFMRAAGLETEEIDAWGHTRSPAFLAKCPAHMTPMLETPDLPKGALWQSCAIMQYLSNKHGLTTLYPTEPAKRAQVDSAMFCLTGTLYQLVARATYPALGFPLYPGEVGASDASDAAKDAARTAATAAIAEPLKVFHAAFIGKGPFIGSANPSIADIRLAATLEFLPVIDYPLPAWAKTYLGAMETALGKAYLEPAADVRGYIQHVWSQKH